VIALGLASRRRGVPGFVQAYAGDVLWGSLFFLLYALSWPRKPALALAAWAIGTTELIELSELYQGEWALRLRATRVGGLLLGHTFLWTDVLCVFLGGALGALLDAYSRPIWDRAARIWAGTKPG
jgi:Protein of unknown function (DUF2809)